MEEILKAFPELDENAAAAIAHEFDKWMIGRGHELVPFDDAAAIVGFAAGWLRRPTSDF
jgi:hypothetical protein